MKELSEYHLPEDIKYTKDHEWAKASQDHVTIGINDYAQDQLGEIVFVELPEIGTVFSQGDAFGTVESVKAVSEIYIPVSGKVIQINQDLENAPELVNQSCYDKGWLIKINASDPGQMDSLLNKAAYMDMLKG